MTNVLHNLLDHNLVLYKRLPVSWLQLSDLLWFIFVFEVALCHSPGNPQPSCMVVCSFLAHSLAQYSLLDINSGLEAGGVHKNTWERV